MNNNDELFPKILRNIENLIEDEEGNIPAKKLLTLGTMIVILGSFLSAEAFAAHRSHSSHVSHRSHSSGSHGSHNNHGSHESHVSHVSHTSHSNNAYHSNSLYSAEGDVRYNAPSAYSVPGISAPPVAVSEESFIMPNDLSDYLEDVLQDGLPDVNESFETPSGTPASRFIPSFAVPAASVDAKIDSGNINIPSGTESIK